MPLEEDFARFQGETQAGIKNICKKLDDTEAARKEGAAHHWENINGMKDDIHAEEMARQAAIHVEELARVKGDTDNTDEVTAVKTSVTKLQTRVGVMAAGITLFITLAWNTVKTWLFSGGNQ